jgi:putative ABC transport system ATP-binding protein
MKNCLLKAINLKKTFIMGEVEVRALVDVSFEIYEGEFIVILGPSGSGKSTLLNLIGGMDKIDGGKLLYRDTEVNLLKRNGLSDYRRHSIGFVFQFYNLIPSLTAYENVALASNLSKNPLQVDKVLNQVGLEDRKGHFPSQMSGGQQQRVAMARAIAKNPDILLCDEPTGALDTESGEMVMGLLKQLNQTYSKTVIVITHDREIAHLADRVFHIRDGQLTHIEEGVQNAL